MWATQADLIPASGIQSSKMYNTAGQEVEKRVVIMEVGFKTDEGTKQTAQDPSMLTHRKRRVC